MQSRNEEYQIEARAIAQALRQLVVPPTDSSLDFSTEFSAQALQTIQTRMQTLLQQECPINTVFDPVIDVLNELSATHTQAPLINAFSMWKNSLSSGTPVDEKQIILHEYESLLDNHKILDDSIQKLRTIQSRMSEMPEINATLEQLIQCCLSSITLLSNISPHLAKIGITDSQKERLATDFATIAQELSDLNEQVTPRSGPQRN